MQNTCTNIWVLISIPGPQTTMGSLLPYFFVGFTPHWSAHAHPGPFHQPPFIFAWIPSIQVCRPPLAPHWWLGEVAAWVLGRPVWGLFFGGPLA